MGAWACLIYQVARHLRGWAYRRAEIGGPAGAAQKAQKSLALRRRSRSMRPKRNRRIKRENKL